MNCLKTFLFSFIFGAAFLMAFPVFAQEDAITENQTETVSAETAAADQFALQAVAADQSSGLEAENPSLLPDSPFYFIKNWSRSIQSFLAFDKAKKAELKFKFASEKMAEAKKLLEKNKTEKALEAVKNSNAFMEKAKEVIGQMENNPKADAVLEKMAQKSIVHQKFLDLLKQDLPEEKTEEIEKLKQGLINSYLSAEKPEKIQERLQKALAGQQGSEFKEFKNMQLLEEMKNIAPEEIKEKIENASENQAKILAKKLESLPEEKIKALEPYIEQLKDSKGLVISLLSRFKNQELSTTSLQKIEKAEEKIMQKIEETKSPEKIKALLEEIEKIIIEWEVKINNSVNVFTIAECKKMPETISLIKKEIEKAKTAINEGKTGQAFGQIIAAKAKTENLIRTFNRCQLKQEKIKDNNASEDSQVLCPALWDPVCAEDGKTYSNECVAEKIKKLKIKYKGECAKTEKENDVSGSESGNSNPAAIANPASVYCKKLGYTLEIRTDAEGGQYGVCIFNDGNECEEWKFFRGECGAEYKNTGAGSENNSSLNNSSVPVSSGSGQ